MAVEDTQKSSDSAPVYASDDIEVSFFDSVINISHRGEIVKMYMCRFDPSINGSLSNKLNITAQIVMPSVGFIQFILFGEKIINDMVANKHITQEQVDEVRRSLSGG